MKKSITVAAFGLLIASVVHAEEQHVFKGVLSENEHTSKCGDHDIVWHPPTASTATCRLSIAHLVDYELTTNVCSFSRVGKAWRRTQALSVKKTDGTHDEATLTVTEYRVQHPNSIELECVYVGSVVSKR